MKESSTYQAILEEGRIEGAVTEAKKLLRVFGDRVFGPPDARIVSAIEGIDDLARLEELCDRVPAVNSWQELIGRPAASRWTRRRQSP